jgi:hypothetical protein
MDQVRMVLTWLKKQHFWVLSGLVGLIALFCWWSAARTLSAKYDTNQKQITGEFNNIAGVKNASFHANPPIIERQGNETKKQTESVTKIWGQLFERQSTTVLKWPSPPLSAEFVKAVEALQFGDEIEPRLRNNYQNYVDRHFPDLVKQISARMLEATTGTGGAGEFGGSPRGFGPEAGGAGLPGTGLLEETDYVCEWLDQGYIRERLNFPERPSSLRIWVTQEDLWVYHTLLDVIDKTNRTANATRMANAAVKVVYELQVGQRAADYNLSTNRLLLPPPAASVVPGAEGAPAPGPEGGAEGGPRPFAGGGERGLGGGYGANNAPMSPADEQNYLLSGRYLNEKGEPIPVGAPGAGAAGPEGGPPPEAAAATNTPAPPLDPGLFGIGYKRLPVRMVMQMDARYLPQLISNCANQPLRVEVQQVRVNPSDVTSADGGFAGGGGGPRGFGGGFGGERGGGAGAPQSALGIFPDRTGLQTFPANPTVVNVVVQGTIFIYNKPNTALLQQGAGGAAATDATATTTTP